MVAFDHHFDQTTFLRKPLICWSSKMEQLTITLPDQMANQLKIAANKTGVKPEEFLIASLQEKLDVLDSEFSKAMRYVLKKNAELYKRLAE